MRDPPRPSGGRARPHRPGRELRGLLRLRDRRAPSGWHRDPAPAGRRGAPLGLRVLVAPRSAARRPDRVGSDRTGGFQALAAWPDAGRAALATHPALTTERHGPPIGVLVRIRYGRFT